jgi:hypothetical protein
LTEFSVTLPLIKTERGELMQFIMGNFIDSTGNPIKESTISDYLNGGKAEKRAGKGTRIELGY